MPTTQPNTRHPTADQWISLAFSVPWLEVFAEVYKLSRKLWQGLADEGMYEVLEHESTLELLDRQGKRARFQER